MFLEENESIRQELLRIAGNHTDEILNQQPGESRWSAMQILDHLQLMETVIAKNIAKELEHGTSTKAVKKPIQLSVSRALKVKAPSYTVPGDEFISLEDMKVKLAHSRNLLNDVYAHADQDMLAAKSMPHPVFGKMPLIQWFTFVGLHEKRHLKQLRETLSDINGSKIH